MFITVYRDIFLHCLSALSGWYPTEDNRDVWAGQTLTSAGAGDSWTKATEGAVRQEARRAAHAGHGDRHKRQVGEGVCKLSFKPTFYTEILHIFGNNVHKWHTECVGTILSNSYLVALCDTFTHPTSLSKVKCWRMLNIQQRQINVNVHSICALILPYFVTKKFIYKRVLNAWKKTK